MEFTTEDNGGVAIARLKGVLDSAGVVRMQEGIENLLIGRERKVVLDFSEIDALDPMGLAELLRLSRWVKEGGLRLRVAHAAPHVEEAFRDNMISDVEFFRDVDAAMKFHAEPPPPPLPVETPTQSPTPKPVPERSFFARYWWLFAGVGLLALLVGVAIVVAGKFTPKKVEFLTGDGQPWTGSVEERLKPGEEKTLRLRVRNADQVLPIRNEEWVEMLVEPGGTEDVKEVVFRFSPTTDFKSTDTYFYVTAGDGKPRLKSPLIYLVSDVKAVLPKFDLSNREYEKEGGNVLLSPGIEGEQYGPDGIPATGGARLQYSARGHEAYGLKFDTITGRFSGEAQKPTPDGGYVKVDITARNEVGEQSLTAMLLIEKKKVVETKTQAVNAFAEEIKKRFDLLDYAAQNTENIRLLYENRDAILHQGEGEIHKVGTVFFPKGATQLPLEYQRRLDAEFEVDGFRDLASDPKTYFFVLGFADKGNTADAVNKRIIKERAEKLKEYLLRHLTDPQKIGMSAAEVAERVKVIPMLPIPENVETGQPKIFDSPERCRAGEIWLVKDPRK